MATILHNDILVSQIEIYSKFRKKMIMSSLQTTDDYWIKSRRIDKQLFHFDK